jgi:imidazolonepropionase-like amidohydrolase
MAADLIAVHGNPLEDPATLKRVFFVLKDGALIRNDP